jgi:hypothetical protein
MPDDCHCKREYSLPLHSTSPQEPHEIRARAYTATIIHEDVDAGKQKADQKEQYVANMVHNINFVILFGTYLWLYCRGRHII